MSTDAAQGLGDLQAALAEASEAIWEGVEGIRQKIAQRQAEIKKAEGAPGSSAEINANVAEVITRLQGNSRGSVGRLHMPCEGGGFIISDATRVLSRATPAELIATIAPELIENWLRREIAALCADAGESLNAPTRAERLKTLRRKLRRLEEQEEEIIASAERAGICIARRPDVSPAVVLGLPDEE
jgi:hypothetical protein